MLIHGSVCYRSPFGLSVLAFFIFLCNLHPISSIICFSNCNPCLSTSFFHSMITLTFLSVLDCDLSFSLKFTINIFNSYVFIIYSFSGFYLILISVYFVPFFIFRFCSFKFFFMVVEDKIIVYSEYK